MNALLPLHADLEIARGVQRTVYLHPTDETKLVKVLIADKNVRRRDTFGGRMDRWFPSTRIRQIRKEYQEYLRIMLRNATTNFRAPISHMYGFVPTTEGLGCLTERVVGSRKAIGETLGAKAKAGRVTAQDIALLNATVAAIYQHGIRASDMNPNNFVFGQRYQIDGLGPRECVLVDGFGDIHAIPVRSLGGWANRMGLDDSCRRLAKNTGLIWDGKERQFQ